MIMPQDAISGVTKKQVDGVAKSSDEKAKKYFILGIALAVFASFFASFLALSLQINFPIEHQQIIVPIVTILAAFGTLYLMFVIEKHC